MATIVCQGLQSCLESQTLEPRTTLRLKLSSPKLLSSQSLELAIKPCASESKINEERSPNPDNGGGWSFLQDLSKSSLTNKENVYIHPLTNRYSSKLSDKSLQLCTESLGCETGSDISSEHALIFESSSSEFGSEEESESEVENSSCAAMEEEENSNSNSKPRQYLESKKASCRSFPPPLTTMSGVESIQFRPHREDGRLILMAVQVPAVQSCFQAERTDGRLRLSFVNDSASNFDLDDEIEEDVEYDVDGEEEEEEEIMEKGNSVEEDSEIEERDTEENNLKFGGEIGKKEIQRQRRRRSTRCKEGELENKGLLNWEPFWVATT
ncbi:protein FANTASTIC FOUR 4 [Euphorbia lathyris]|uniref:protein FANTASTIC FOUR 4 n=1 Tax=Euphorbia lathyris TaxID=212925 RepID=UPI003313CC94